MDIIIVLRKKVDISEMIYRRLISDRNHKNL